MRYIALVYIILSTSAYANCRVVNDNFVCDNSNTFIDTYHLLTKPVPVPQQVYIVNQPVQLPDITAIPPVYDYEILKNLNTYDYNYGESK